MVRSTFKADIQPGVSAPSLDTLLKQLQHHRILLRHLFQSLLDDLQITLNVRDERQFSVDEPWALPRQVQRLDPH